MNKFTYGAIGCALLMVSTSVLALTEQEIIAEYTTVAVLAKAGLTQAARELAQASEQSAFLTIVVDNILTSGQEKPTLAEYQAMTLQERTNLTLAVLTDRGLQPLAIALQTALGMSPKVQATPRRASPTQEKTQEAPSIEPAERELVLAAIKDARTKIAQIKNEPDAVTFIETLMAIDFDEATRGLIRIQNALGQTTPELANLLSEVHTLKLQQQGLEEFQKISTSKSFAQALATALEKDYMHVLLKRTLWPMTRAAINVIEPNELNELVQLIAFVDKNRNRVAPIAGGPAALESDLNRMRAVEEDLRHMVLREQAKQR